MCRGFPKHILVKAQKVYFACLDCGCSYVKKMKKKNERKKGKGQNFFITRLPCHFKEKCQDGSFHKGSPG